MTIAHPYWTTARVHTQAQLDVARALAEDVGTGDLTAALVPAQQRCRARVLAREEAVICGRPWFEAAVLALDPAARFRWSVDEGQCCAVNQVVVEIEGMACPLLTAERTALNFLQLLSAVATKVSHYAALVQGTQARVVDTRKTLPGLRMAQKYAVVVGGGVNHRLGLFDAILIKENHIAAAGGIAPVLQRAFALAGQAQFVEIEVERLDQLQEALACGAKMILLDNMDTTQLRAAVRINAEVAAAHGGTPAILESSGGVTQDSLRALADTGVDRISIGALTKDVKAIDFSMRFETL
jgi:nicotinate-nucleotide pyrophosphorylase (carboxylating)